MRENKKRKLDIDELIMKTNHFIEQSKFWKDNPENIDENLVNPIKLVLNSIINNDQIDNATSNPRDPRTTSA